MGDHSIVFHLRGCYKHMLWSCLARIGQSLWPAQTVISQHGERSCFKERTISGGDEENKKTVVWFALRGCVRQA